MLTAYVGEFLAVRKQTRPYSFLSLEKIPLEQYP